MQEKFGTDTKSFHVGRAAQGGMLAALLAKNGYTSPLQSLEAKYGCLHVVSTREDAAAYFDQLGDTWGIEKNTFKPFPCGIVMHPVIDGAIQLRNETSAKDLSVTDIKTVDLRVNPKVLMLTSKTTPQTGLEGKFSIYHAAAIGLFYGETTPANFTDDIIKNSDIINMRNEVNVTEDKSVPKAAVFVSVQFDNGQKLDKHIEHAKGSIENPLTDEELKAKFMDQITRAIGEERAEKAHAAFQA